jgi:hypothetical protein
MLVLSWHGSFISKKGLDFNVFSDPITIQVVFFESMQISYFVLLKYDLQFILLYDMLNSRFWNFDMMNYWYGQMTLSVWSSSFYLLENKCFKDDMPNFRNMPLTVLVCVCKMADFLSKSDKIFNMLINWWNSTCWILEIWHHIWHAELLKYDIIFYLKCCQFSAESVPGASTGKGYIHISTFSILCCC